MEIPKKLELIMATVSEQDRRFFEAHPGAVQYLRLFVPGEAYPETHDPLFIG